MALRAQANQEGDAMARCFQQSHDAYARGDGAGAKQLSNQGHEHQHKMESLNKQASDWIFVGMWSRGNFRFLQFSYVHVRSENNKVCT
jgi:hypothetical protein